MKGKTSSVPDKMEVYHQSVANSTEIIQLLKSNNAYSANTEDLTKETVANARESFALNPTEHYRKLLSDALDEQRAYILFKKRASHCNDFYRLQYAPTSVSSQSSSSSALCNTRESTNEKKRFNRDLTYQFDDEEGDAECLN
jgi:hypothetical protein